MEPIAGEENHSLTIVFVDIVLYRSEREGPHSHKTYRQL